MKNYDATKIKQNLEIKNEESTKWRPPDHKNTTQNKPQSTALAAAGERRKLWCPKTKKWPTNQKSQQKSYLTQWSHQNKDYNTK